MTSRRFVVDQSGGNIALDLFVLDQHLGLLIDSALASTGVTANLYAVSAQLDRGPLTPRQLSELLGIRPTTLSGHLGALERAGHATRSRHPADGRSWLVELTPAGRAKVAECRPLLRQAVAALHDELGDAAEVDAVRALLGRLDAAILAARERL